MSAVASEAKQLMENTMRVLGAIILLFTVSPIFAATSSKCPGETGYVYTNNRTTNPTNGGFVGNGAFVDESAFIAPTAAVCESATINAGVRLLGNAVVKGEAILDGKVQVSGNAIIGGTAYISGSGRPTIIRGYSRIFSGEITSGIHGTNEKPKELVAKELAANAASARRKVVEAFKELKNLTYRYMLKHKKNSRREYKKFDDEYIVKGELEWVSQCELKGDWFVYRGLDFSSYVYDDDYRKVDTNYGDYGENGGIQFRNPFSFKNRTIYFGVEPSQKNGTSFGSIRISHFSNGTTIDDIAEKSRDQALVILTGRKKHYNKYTDEDQHHEAYPAYYPFPNLYDLRYVKAKTSSSWSKMAELSSSDRELFKSTSKELRNALSDVAKSCGGRLVDAK